MKLLKNKSLKLKKAVKDDPIEINTNEIKD